MPILEADCPSEFLLLESRSNQGGTVAVDTTHMQKKAGRPTPDRPDPNASVVTIHSLAKLRAQLRAAVMRYKIATAMKEVCMPDRMPCMVSCAYIHA